MTKERFQRAIRTKIHTLLGPDRWSKYHNSILSKVEYISTKVEHSRLEFEECVGVAAEYVAACFGELT